jgi:hypothetical protein
MALTGVFRGGNATLIRAQSSLVLAGLSGSAAAIASISASGVARSFAQFVRPSGFRLGINVPFFSVRDPRRNQVVSSGARRESNVQDDPVPAGQHIVARLAIVASVILSDDRVRILKKRFEIRKVDAAGLEYALPLPVMPRTGRVLSHISYLHDHVDIGNAQSLALQAQRFVELLADVAKFPLASLHKAG